MRGDDDAYKVIHSKMTADEFCLYLKERASFKYT